MIFSSVETTALDPCCSRAIDCENALRRSPVRRDKFGSCLLRYSAFGAASTDFATSSRLHCVSKEAMAPFS
jgi:hypothetical protein